MSTNRNELNYHKEIVDSGLSELGAKKNEFQELAETVYNITNLIMNSSDLFSKIATPYGMCLKELSYRLQVIAFGFEESNKVIDSYNCGAETKNGQSICYNVFKDVNHKNVRDLYDLADINFPKAILLCDELKNVNEEYTSVDGLDEDFLKRKFGEFKKAIDEAIKNPNIETYENSIKNTQEARWGAMADYFAAKEKETDPVVPNGGENTKNPDKGQFTPANNTKEETKADTTATSKTDTGKKDTTKTDTSKSDIKPSTDKTEPSKDTDTKTPDTKEPDKTIENKPQPDSPTTITDNKGSSGVSHGTSSSSSNSNGNGNYTFTNSGISASQDEPIESLTDESPTEGSNTTLPVDEEDVYTIPTDLSGVTSKTKNSSGGSGVLPVIGGLGAAAAVGVGAKIYMDNKKNNDNGEDSDETDEISNTDDWTETTDGNDGILADEWNEDDSNFEFEDSETDSDDEESGFGEI